MASHLCCCLGVRVLHDEGVHEDLLQAEAVPRVAPQNAPNQILGQRTHIRPLWEMQIAPHNALVGIGRRRGHEGRLPDQQLVQQHAQGPNCAI